jgi:hypothetical protein
VCGVYCVVPAHGMFLSIHSSEWDLTRLDDYNTTIDGFRGPRLTPVCQSFSCSAVSEGLRPLYAPAFFAMVMPSLWR